MAGAVPPARRLGPVPPRSGPGAVIGDLDAQAGALVSDGDLAVTGAGVLDHVGQRLLHDAERRLADPGRDVPVFPGPGHVHADARACRGGDQPLQVGQAGSGRERQLPGRLTAAAGPAGAVLAEHAEQPLHVGERLPGDVLDGAERLPRLRGLMIEDVFAETGLHRDHGHAVRHDIVQLPGDPQPFPGHGGGGHLLAYPRGIGAALLRADADHPGDDQEQRDAGRGARPPSGHAEDEPLDDEQRQGGGERHRRDRPGARGRHHVQGEREGQERAAVDLSAHRDDQRAAGQRQDERAHGVAAAQPHRERHDGGQQRRGPGARQPERQREHVDPVALVHDAVDEHGAHGGQGPVDPGPGALLEPRAQRWAAALSANFTASLAGGRPWGAFGPGGCGVTLPRLRGAVSLLHGNAWPGAARHA